MNLSTLVLHGGTDAVDFGTPSPVVTPLVQSVNFVQPAGETDILYTRHGNTPNVRVVEERMALLEGSEAALVTASGMGAMACAMLALLKPGDHLLSANVVYGGSRHFLETELVPFGIDVTFADPFDEVAWEAAFRPNTKVVFIESPINPTCRVVDIREIAREGHEHGCTVVIDSTLATPVNCRPLDLGVDVVIHSGTKFLNGHHDAVLGVVAGPATVVETARHKMIAWGQSPDPFACWLLERGLKTLPLRVQCQNGNAFALARWFTTREEVATVHYPGLPDHPDHFLARDMMSGFGGMLGIELRNNSQLDAGEAASRLIQRLRIVKHAGSLGGVDSLISEPRFASHADLSPEERSAIGIPDGFLRISVGIEHVYDLIADFEQAFQ